jgi:hypothetical protein
MFDKILLLSDKTALLQRTSKLGCLLLGLACFANLQVRAAEAAQPVAFNPVQLQQAAASGDATAEFDLGTLDYVGIGVVQDYIGAVDILKQAALANNAEAQCELGFLYQTGSFAQGPPPPDPKDALPWYRDAAGGCRRHCQCGSGNCFVRAGRGAELGSGACNISIATVAGPFLRHRLQGDRANALGGPGFKRGRRWRVAISFLKIDPDLAAL